MANEGKKSIACKIIDNIKEDASAQHKIDKEKIEEAAKEGRF